MEQVAHYDGRHSDARNSAITACAIACTRVLEHDETAARQAIDAHLDAHPIDDRLGTLHLGRHLAVGYVLVPELRQHWDAAALGPHHVRVREAARRFLDARRGELDSGAVLPGPRTRRHGATAPVVRRARGRRPVEAARPTGELC